MQKLKIGVLGVSNHFIKRIVLPIQSIDSIDLMAISSRSEAKAKEAARNFNIPKAYGSYEELLNDSELNAVYIPLPNHLHSQWIKRAANAGKHILCEKPLCLNTEEVKQVVEYTEARGVQLMEAFMYKFHPQWQAVRNIIRTNNIGKVNFIHTSFSYNNPSPSNIRNIKAFGGGGLMDIGCYAISCARFLLEKEPIRVVSQMSHHDVFETDYITSALMDFGTSRASFHVSTASDSFQKVEIVGTAGHIIIHLPFNTYTDVPAKVSVSTALGQRDIEFEPVDQYALMFKSFSESILNKSELAISLNDSLLNQKIMDAIFRSINFNKWAIVK